MWTTILLYILIFLLGFFFGLILPLMSISKAFKQTDADWVKESHNHNFEWDNGCHWHRSTFYRNFYGGKK